MANYTTTPNLDLYLPTPETDPDPDWATLLNANFVNIDANCFSSGYPVPSEYININADLPFNNFRATLVKAIDFVNLGATLSDLNALYVKGGNLYFNDGAGNRIQLTANGALNISTGGTITGLVSPAQASFSGGNFTWLSNTTGPVYASMLSGPVIVFAASGTPSYGVMLQSPVLAASVTLTLPTVSLTFPTTVPASLTSYLTVNTAGQINPSVVAPPNAPPAVKGFVSMDTTGQEAVQFALMPIPFGGTPGAGTSLSYTYLGIGPPGQASYGSGSSALAGVVMPFSGVVAGIYALFGVGSVTDGTIVHGTLNGASQTMGFTIAAGGTSGSTTSNTYAFTTGQSIGVSLIGVTGISGAASNCGVTLSVYQTL